MVCTSIDETTVRSFVAAAMGPDYSPTALRSLDGRQRCERLLTALMSA